MSGDFLPDVYLKQSHSFAVIRIRIKSRNIDKVHIHILSKSLVYQRSYILRRPQNFANSPLIFDCMYCSQK